MELEYYLNKQDYIDFNIYHVNHSDIIKKSLLIQRYFIPIIFMIVPFLIAGVTDLPLLYWICVFIVISVVWIVFYPKYFVWAFSKRVSKMVDEGKNKDLFGKHRVTVNEEGILEKSENGENKISWSGVEKIVSSNQHIFIYIGSISACIIPKRAFKSNADMELFHEYISKYITGKRD